ncbi:MULTISPECIES: hypothetical protein [unclassified Actinoplanes]|uniref:hypothetical protein n=1 Tax=unclassified Actinoplanes TaxID=2626549 RepID=UPI000317F257|nr:MULTISPECIES: hypothetical protein [unclassified Actinoplanes]
MSLDSDFTGTPGQRAAACLAFAARARARADQLERTAQTLIDRAAVAHRAAEDASARVTGSYPAARRQLLNVSLGDTP